MREVADVAKLFVEYGCQYDLPKEIAMYMSQWILCSLAPSTVARAWTSWICPALEYKLTSSGVCAEWDTVARHFDCKTIGVNQ